MNMTSMIASGVFSAIGIAALIYGKKQSLVKPMLIGSALIAYPYFFTDAVMTIVIGILLTAMLFIRLR